MKNQMTNTQTANVASLQATEALQAANALQLTSTQSTNVALKKCATIVGLLNKQWNDPEIHAILAEAMPSVYGEKKITATFTTDKEIVTLMDYFTATKQGASNFKAWCKKNGYTYDATKEQATKNKEPKAESVTA